MTDRATCVLIGEVVAGAAGRPTVGIAGRNVVAVQIDRRRVEFGGYFHVFLQRFEQIGDRVAPCFAAKLLQCGFQRLLARLLGDEACPFVKLRRPLCSGAFEIAPRLSEPVAASLCHGASYAHPDRCATGATAARSQQRLYQPSCHVLSTAATSLRSRTQAGT